MPDCSFFQEQEEQSRIKSEIVAKYFWAWAKVIISEVKRRGGEKIAYIDLFAGPGRYADGTPSTPVKVLERAIRDPNMSQMLVALFNDSDPGHAAKLRTAVAELPGIENLRYPPVVQNFTVGDEVAAAFDKLALVPTLLFADPWGYRGVTRKLIASVVKDWGCECIMFFNYRRINMALQNLMLQEPVDALFGAGRVEELKLLLPGLSSDDRELLIIEKLTQALSESKRLYVLPFRFRDERGTRTSHHLVFIAKSVLGYTIMKDIMAKASSCADQGVASLEYNRASRDFPLLFELTRPLDDLAGMLLSDYAGKSMTVEGVFRNHHVGRPYTLRNYKDVLAKLDDEGRIEVVSTKGKRRRNTFPEHLIVKFPPLRS
jgi:three-Cys-motif partner protein